MWRDGHCLAHGVRSCGHAHHGPWDAARACRRRITPRECWSARCSASLAPRWVGPARAARSELRADARGARISRRLRPLCDYRRSREGRAGNATPSPARLWDPLPPCFRMVGRWNASRALPYAFCCDSVSGESRELKPKVPRFNPNSAPLLSPAPQSPPSPQRRERPRQPRQGRLTPRSGPAAMGADERDLEALGKRLDKPPSGKDALCKLLKARAPPAERGVCASLPVGPAGWSRPGLTGARRGCPHCRRASPTRWASWRSAPCPTR